MKFVTNRIHFGQPKNNKVAEMIKAASSKPAEGQVKTASAKKPDEVKVEQKKEANIKNLGEYAHPKGGKKKNEQPVEAVEPEVETEEVVAEGEVEIKVAEGKQEGVEGYEAGKKEANEFTNDADKKPEDCEEPEKNAGKAATTKTKTQDGTFPSSGQPQWEGKPENNNDPEMPNEKNTKASADDHLKKIQAKLEGSFVKVSKLSPEMKKETREYWRALYGDDYADAMVSDQ